MNTLKISLKKATLIVPFLILNLAIATVVHVLWTDSHRSVDAAWNSPVGSLSDEDRLIQAVDKASSAVVSILVQKEQQETRVLFFNGEFRQLDSGDGLVEIGRGTGFLVSKDGMIVTNRHVASDRNAKYTVFLHDDSKYDAQILDIDPVNDLALIKINGEDLSTLEFEESGHYRIGQTVVAIGNALGKYANTVTRGILSGVGRSVDASNHATGMVEHLDDILQTDAAINFGNSGGPLINLDGKVIGVNTAVEQSGQGLGFAIPVSEVRKIMESFGDFGSIARPRLGVRYFMITPDIAEIEELAYLDGALIKGGENGSAILPNSPAAVAGLRDGDIILSVDGQLLTEKHSLADAIRSHQVGDRVELKVARGNEDFIAIVTLDGYPPYGF